MFRDVGEVHKLGRQKITRIRVRWNPNSKFVKYKILDGWGGKDRETGQKADNENQAKNIAAQHFNDNESR